MNMCVIHDDGMYSYKQPITTFGLNERANDWPLSVSSLAFSDKHQQIVSKLCFAGASYFVSVGMDSDAC